MLTKTKVVIKDDDNVFYNGIPAWRLKAIKNGFRDDTFCRKVFMGPDFVVKFDNPDDIQGLQTENEITTIRALIKIGGAKFVPKILDHGFIKYYDWEVAYIVQERIYGVHASEEELVKFRIFLKTLSGVEPYRYLLCDIHEHNVIKRPNGEFVAVDLGSS